MGFLRIVKKILLTRGASPPEPPKWIKFSLNFQNFLWNSSKFYQFLQIFMQKFSYIWGASPPDPPTPTSPTRSPPEPKSWRRRWCARTFRSFLSAGFLDSNEFMISNKLYRSSFRYKYLKDFHFVFSCEWLLGQFPVKKVRHESVSDYCRCRHLFGFCRNMFGFKNQDNCFFGIMSVNPGFVNCAINRFISLRTKTLLNRA